MSSSKTTNLQLNQWELDDKFKMEEFNADNSAIDTAIGALREAQVVEKLFSVVTTAPCAQINLDVSKINWSNYLKVCIYWQLVPSIETNDNINALRACIRVNNDSAENYYIVGDTYSSISVSDVMMYPQNVINLNGGTKVYKAFLSEIYPIFGEMIMRSSCISINNARENFDYAGMYASTGSPQTVIPLSSVNTINFFERNSSTVRTLLPGCKFFVYGVRK